MTITFCGHSDVYDNNEVEYWLFKITEDLIQKGAKTFYLGGYVSFDILAKSLLLKHKKNYPSIDIVLVVPYISHNMFTDGYDGTLHPTVPPRFAIVKRNEWMVQEADVVIAYVTHSYGGAASMLKYAKGKTISSALGRSIDYVENPNKTNDSEFISSYACDPLIAEQEFLFSKSQYTSLTGRTQGDKDVIAYNLRQA